MDSRITSTILGMLHQPPPLALRRLGRVERRDFAPDRLAGIPLRDLQIVRPLEIEPELRGRPQPPPEPQGGIRGDAAPASQDLRNSVGWNAQRRSILICVQSELRQDVFGENLAGMNRPTLAKCLSRASFQKCWPLNARYRIRQRLRLVQGPG